MKNVYFVSGIDTNIGKSYATGYIARKWNEQGIRTITQKLVQTGNTDWSEDIELHRKLMGTNPFPDDYEKLTMPEIYTYPSSPHLASEIDGTFKEYSKDTKVGAIERTFSVYSFIGKIKYEVDEKDAILLVEYNGKYQEFDRYELKNGLLTIDIQSDEDWAKNFVITTKSNYQQYTEQGVED